MVTWPFQHLVIGFYIQYFLLAHNRTFCKRNTSIYFRHQWVFLYRDCIDENNVFLAMDGNCVLQHLTVFSIQWKDQIWKMDFGVHFTLSRTTDVTIEFSCSNFVKCVSLSCFFFVVPHEVQVFSLCQWKFFRLLILFFKFFTRVN